MCLAPRAPPCSTFLVQECGVQLPPRAECTHPDRLQSSHPPQRFPHPRSLWVGLWVRGTVLFRPFYSLPIPASPGTTGLYCFCHLEEQESCILSKEKSGAPSEASDGPLGVAVPRGASMRSPHLLCPVPRLAAP